MWVNQEDRKYFACSQKFIVSWNLFGGGMCTVCAIGTLWRANAAYAQSCKQLKYSMRQQSAYNIANVLSLYWYDYNISCSGGLQISFRYCGNFRHFDQVTRWGGKWKSGRKWFREFQVSGGRDWGNCLVCNRITSHMLCHKKINNVMTNVWQICQLSNCHAYARPISHSPLSLSPSLCRLLCVQYAWYARHVVYLCLPHTAKLRLFFG